MPRTLSLFIARRRAPPTEVPLAKVNGSITRSNGRPGPGVQMTVTQLRGESLPLLSEADWLNRLERGRAEGLKTAIVAGEFAALSIAEQDLLRLLHHLCDLVGVVVIEQTYARRAAPDVSMRAARVAALRSVHAVVVALDLKHAEQLREAFLPDLYVHVAGLSP